MASGCLPAEELQRLSTWPAEVARSDLAAHCTFSLEDLRWVRSHRGAGERIGLAVQLAALRLLGFVPVELVETAAGGRSARWQANRRSRNDVHALRP
ncbi:MAG: DUF4158 domain-containing protein [Actinobacteria bacterium]|nr:DUF4158 domain-containing protein [Actinomycetota bacterium]